MFVFRSGLRFSFWALEVPEPRVRKWSCSLTKNLGSALPPHHLDKIQKRASFFPRRKSLSVGAIFRFASISISIIDRCDLNGF